MFSFLGVHFFPHVLSKPTNLGLKDKTQGKTPSQFRGHLSLRADFGDFGHIKKQRKLISGSQAKTQFKKIVSWNC